MKGVDLNARPYGVMAGLVPAIHDFLFWLQRLLPADKRETDGALDARFIQIIPFRIHRMNESHLPGARPMLDDRLALNSIPDIVEVLRINQPFQAVTFCESVNKSLPMLKSAPWQIARDAGIQNAVASIGHEINPAARHLWSKARRGWPEQVRP
jgi:hypothetical protein